MPTKETAWIDIMTAIHIQNKEQNDKNLTSEINKYAQMTTDVNRAFLLYCTSMVNYHLMHNTTYGVIHFARIAAISTFYTLKDSDPHYQQVLINLEYSLQFASKTLSAERLKEMQSLIKLLKTKEMVEGIDKKYKIDPSKKQLPEVSASRCLIALAFSCSKCRSILFIIKI